MVRLTVAWRVGLPSLLPLISTKLKVYDKPNPKKIHDNRQLLKTILTLLKHSITSLLTFQQDFISFQDKNLKKVRITVHIILQE